ncbi:MAG TPA: CBS domain-containing protein [Nitrosopumilaceae archaeon]|nr:CBS domain-containing protein [Nitrosopumilaceae archaeon]
MSVEMLDESISKFTNPKLTAVSSELTVTDAAKVMADSKVDSVLVFENDSVVGIITDKDILVGVVAKGIDPSKILVKDITHKSIIKIHKNSKVKDAIELMNKHNIRRLIVHDDKRPIGVISRKKIVGDMNEYAIALPELEIPNKIKCPYCSSEFDDKQTLSSHIDKIHIGPGLLEGDLSKSNELGSVNPADTYTKTL